MTQVTARDLCSWLLLLIAVGGWFALVRPPALGGATTYLFVRGDSMTPTYTDGDLVIVRGSDSYRAGDVAAFHVPDPSGGQHTVLHRIVGGDTDAGYLLQGDNRSYPDPWRPTDDDMVGTARFAIPRLGRLLAMVADPIPLGGVSAAVAGLTAAACSDDRSRARRGTPEDAAVWHARRLPSRPAWPPPTRAAPSDFTLPLQDAEVVR